MLHCTAFGVSPTLNYVDLTVIINTECAATYGSIITDTNICTASPNGQSTCSVSFYLDILQKFTSYCPQHKTCCHQQDHLYSNQLSLFYASCAKCITIHRKHMHGPKSVCNVIHFFFLYHLH